MLICFEGLDRSGKSTLIAAVRAARPDCLVYQKPIAPDLESSDYPRYFQGAGMALAALHGCVPSPVLVDRSYISDWVYSDGESLGWARWQEWENLALRMGDVRVVYVEVDDQTLVDRLRINPDPFCGEADIPVFRSRYSRYFELTAFPITACDGAGDIVDSTNTVVSLLGEAP